MQLHEIKEQVGMNRLKSDIQYRNRSDECVAGIASGEGSEKWRWIARWLAYLTTLPTHD